jgi:N-dimethylarginine dimethylaminohydrolase
MKNVIIVGSANIYNEKYCPKNKKTFEKVDETLKSLQKILEKLKIKVLKPSKESPGELCRSLWVRDTSLNVDNRLYLIPHMVNISRRNRQPEAEVDTLPNEVKGFAKRIFSNIILDGGDVIQDDNIIYVGKGRRTGTSGLLWLKSEFPEKHIIQINHESLHLDSCFNVLPNKRVIYSKRYIKFLPTYVKNNYEIICVEDYIDKTASPELATNILIFKNNLIAADLKKFEKLYKHLEDLGYDMHYVPFYNLYRDHGGVRCLTSWYKVDNEIV